MKFSNQLFNRFSFLGYVDRLGIAYEAPSIATGYGAYIAQVHMKNTYTNHYVTNILITYTHLNSHYILI